MKLVCEICELKIKKQMFGKFIKKQGRKNVLSN